MNCNDFKIGSSEASFRPLVDHNIPLPDRWTFRPYARTEVAGDGTILAFGFPTASWQWDVLTQQQINALLAYIQSGNASGSVFISTPDDRADVRTFSAVMVNILDGEGRNLISQTLSRPAYTDVSVTFTHLIAEED